jgi:hypothetical protein
MTLTCLLRATIGEGPDQEAMVRDRYAETQGMNSFSKLILAPTQLVRIFLFTFLMEVSGRNRERAYRSRLQAFGPA